MQITIDRRHLLVGLIAAVLAAMVVAAVADSQGDDLTKGPFPRVTVEE